VKVYVKLYSLLRKHHPGPDRSQPFAVELPTGATIAAIAPALNLPAPLVRSVFVNSEAVELDTVLNDGDLIGIFPPVVGGAE
jgi:molybdopterin converting factor small subunit